MQPSPAIREIQLREFQATKAKDLASVMALWSSEPGAMLIGTDPSEWLTTREAIEQIERAALENTSGRMPDDLEIVAYEEGTVGWANVRYTAKLPNGGSFLIRWTVIYHQEGGQWKMVNGHASLGIPDDKVMTFFSPA
ncbi:MAG TPA: nuclear transport factor 2 family protein [Ktedonobacterales bacterium]|nr:nuclear transport factor 2 family protein [Ktedonobacterales bacterium]